MGSMNPSGLVIFFFYVKVSFLSTEWVDYVEVPMKYQVLRPQFFSIGGWGVVGFGVVVGDPFSRHAAMWLFHLLNLK